MRIQWKRRVLSLLLAILTMLTTLPLSGLKVEAAGGTGVHILYNGAAVDSVVVAENEEITLTSEVSGISADKYHWQIRIDEEQNIWADIDGYDSATCKVGYALVKTMLDSTHKAYLRLAVDSAEETHTSNPIAVEIAYVVKTSETVESYDEIWEQETVVESVPVTKMRMAAAATENVNTTKYNVIVNFTYKDSGEAVTAPFAASIGANEDLQHPVEVPEKAGYAPFYDANRNGVLEEEEELKPSEEGGNIYFELSLENIMQSYTFDIFYKPILVDFKVEHYFLNTDEEGYELRYTTTGKQFTGHSVPADLELTGEMVEGYTAQTYNQLVVAADGSTVVKIYYHINYYLVDYDLDGGHAVVPIYARYGTVVTIKTPKKAGFAFAGWKLVSVDGVEPTPEQEATYNLNIGSSITVPDASLKFLALWTVTDTSYTVVYWREAESVAGENSEPRYEFWGSELKGAYYDTNNDLVYDGTVKSNTEVRPGDYKDLPEGISVVTHTSSTGETTTFDEAQFFEYNATKTEYDAEGNPIVHSLKGDGTTVVEVYYTRKSYKLKFYYAISSEEEEQENYYVIGGWSNYFGSSARSGTDRDSDIALLDQYNNTNVSGQWGYGKPINQRGQVETLPTLNENGMSKGYVTGYESSTVNNTAYKYHYLSFEAKYNADISNMWPVDVINTVERMGGNNGSWTSKTAVVSAWNGEYNVYYSQHNSNNTIKGKYNKLGYQILWDTERTGGKTAGDDNTIAYLCFWENGVTGLTGSWNVPELYHYNIWIETLNSSDDATYMDGYPADTLFVKKNNKWYYRADSYPTVDDSNISSQTVPPLQGYSYVSRDYTQLTEFDTSVYKEAYDLNFYYDRTRYTLEFNNEGKRLELEGTPEGVYTIRYGVPLWAADMTPPYPEEWDEEMKEGYWFEGWYTSPNFATTTKFEFDEKTTMPASDVILFANWLPVEHSVALYADYADIEQDKMFYPIAVQVTHGKYAPTPNTPEKGKYDFVGWFYEDVDENGKVQEHAFVFESIPIMQDMKIYAKWSSNIAVPYTIYYKCVIDGTEVEVAPPTVGTALAGTTKTVEAKTGNQLDAEYRIGYFPKTSGSHTIKIELEEENAYTFYYEEVEEVPYTVRYLDAQTQAEIAPAKTIEDNRYTVVTEIFEHVEGYLPDAYQKRLIVASDNPDNNVITFYYTENSTEAYYRIVHYAEGFAENTYIEYREMENVGDINETIVETVLNIQGFEFKPEKVKINGALAPNAVGTDDEGNVVVSGNVTAQNGLLIEIYYDRLVYDYTVNYIEEKTGDILATPKLAKGRYGTTITEYAPNFTAYALITDSPQVRTMLEDHMVINFYYQEDIVTVSYVALEGGTVSQMSEPTRMKTGSLNGSTAEAEAGHHFVGWYKDAACTIPVDTAWLEGTKLLPQKVGGFYQNATYYALFERTTADLLIYTTYPQGNNYEQVDPNHTYSYLVEGMAGTITEGYQLTVTLHGLDSITITDIPVGTYRVTQMTDWSWRYEPLRQNYRDITVSALDTTGNWVRFTNTRMDPYWLDGDSYKVNLFKPN